MPQQSGCATAREPQYCAIAANPRQRWAKSKRVDLREPMEPLLQRIPLTAHGVVAKNVKDAMPWYRRVLIRIKEVCFCIVRMNRRQAHKKAEGQQMTIATILRHEVITVD